MAGPSTNAAQSRRFFRALPPGGWVNLGLAACLAFYVIQVLLDSLWNNFCGHLGIDFCAFWSAGRAADLYGYAAAYDTRILTGIQSAILPAAAQGLPVSPVAYLPAFLLPFQLLALLPAPAGFWVWTVVNAVCYVAYLRFFNQRTSSRPLPARLLVMFSLSLPVFWNFLDGQVNVWLMICIGEFMRRFMAGQPLRAGLWLGGLLLKPQALILIVLAILLQRSVRAIAGLATTAAALLAGSFALVGPTGALEVLQIWLGFARGIPPNDVELMMNWRMLALHLAAWISPVLGWAIAVAGIFATAAAALWLWRRHVDSESPAFAMALLGTLAATGMVAWHSNIHMAMILVPPMLLLRQQETGLRQGALDGWVLIPAAAYIFAYVIAALVRINLLPGGVNPFLDFFRGASEFGVSAWILVLAMQQSAQSGRQIPAAAA